MCSKPIYHGPKVKDTQSFIQKAQFVHGDRYSYDKVEYVGTHSKITINCKKHGDFEQSPASHLGGCGCPSCKFDSKRSNTEEFIQKAKSVHDEKYSYDKSEYVNVRTKIIITCPVHGDFEQTPNAHLKGQACPSCKNESYKSNTENFIEQAKVVHDNKFGYEKADYTGALTNVIITCKKHGDFNQQPANHLSGKGCPSCAYESLSGGYTNNKEEYKEESAILYHVRFTVKETDESFEKFGITKNSVKQRFRINKDHDLKLEVINEYPTTLYEAIELEQEIKEYLNENDLAFRVQTLKQHKIPGWTECFRCGDLDGILDTSCFS